MVLVKRGCPAIRPPVPHTGGRASFLAASIASDLVFLPIPSSSAFQISHLSKVFKKLDGTRNASSPFGLRGQGSVNPRDLLLHNVHNHHPKWSGSHTYVLINQRPISTGDIQKIHRSIHDSQAPFKEKNICSSLVNYPCREFVRR